ncbi:fibrobacter succinogenes major paralogous domain-containing protein [Ascidiimonas sp. W6]|uniref:fibrobacter succinogenes major paralogous domain-containing protein n=1 Tax=Ascidiimonas meishanensis TaxID=3128903 RepID=UPI0030EE148C
MRKTVVKLLVLLPFLMAFQCDEDRIEPVSTVTDIEGNVYHTLEIGNQTWMLENLKTTTFNDGTPIEKYEFGMDWGDLPDETPQYQWADTSDLNNVVEEELPFDFYGAMYNHWAIQSGKLAPNGWRIPTPADFEELENYLSNNGFEGNEAIALKSVTGWLPSSGNGTDELGFNGLPNGYVNTFGGPTAGQAICTWATTNVNTALPLGSRTRVMVQLFNAGTILYNNNSIRIGAGIRCIKE